MMCSRQFALVANGKILHKFFSSVNQNPFVLKQWENIVDCYSKIHVNSDVNVEVRPYNVFECKDSNKLRATLTNANDANDNHGVEMNIKVSGEKIEITNKSIQNVPDHLKCVIEVPIRADLHIISKESVSIADMYNDEVKVVTQKNTNIKNLRSTLIDVLAEYGMVKCKGLLLGKDVRIAVRNNGNIDLDKVQGDSITCQTAKGNINTNSCYALNSKFITENGILRLKNIHKTSEVYVQKHGDIIMTGLHGNFQIQSEGGDINIQLSEIFGDNLIQAKDSKQCIVNISDVIEETSSIEITAQKIILDNLLSHLSDCIQEEKIFKMSMKQNHSNKLKIFTKGEVKLGKMSWADNMKIAMGVDR